MTHCTFDDWIRKLFNHRELEPGWFGNAVYDADTCDLSPRKGIAYVTEAFENARIVFEPYTNAQVNYGLWYLVGASGVLHPLADDAVPWAERDRCIESFKAVYDGLFAQRCTQALSHRDEAPDNALNSICYMWWDIFPMWGSLMGQPKLDDRFLDVMAHALTIPHDACRESALHGLGHMPTHEDAIHAIIDRFLADNPGIRPELRAYAESARASCIQ
jgi:hypothetical protein